MGSKIVNNSLMEKKVWPLKEKGHLKTHIESVQTEKQSFECDIFLSNFTEKGNFKKLIKSVH